MPSIGNVWKKVTWMVKYGQKHLKVSQGRYTEWTGIHPSRKGAD